MAKEFFQKLKSLNYKIAVVNSANEEIKALDSLNTKTTAVFNKQYRSGLKSLTYEKDSLAIIELVDYRPNFIKYKSY